MNIVIDQGNTAVKIAIFDKNTVVDTFKYRHLSMSRLQGILNKYPVNKGIYSSVSTRNQEVINYLNVTLVSFFEVNESLPLPIKINYKTPSTLGKDRLAAVVGAYIQKKGENILVIDAGTAITYDFVDAEGMYWGGNISPGMNMRFKALHQYTKRLPLLDETGEIPNLGYDTDTAIRSGIVEGIRREMDSYIDEYKKKQNVFTFLTGGQAFYFDSKLKNHTFADGNLVLKGLNEILNYQYEQI